MTDKIVNIPSAVWVILLVLTLISVAIAEGAPLGTYSALAVVLIAAIKSRLVILHYMEAKHAPAHWRFLYETWNFAAAATIIIGHYMALAKSV
jgi:hypothetical protein